jgi:hypothetical protein
MGRSSITQVDEAGIWADGTASTYQPPITFLSLYYPEMPEFATFAKTDG